MTEQNQDLNQETLTKITDVQEMGNVVTTWHYNVLSQIAHVLQMPEDAGIDIPTGEVDENDEPVYIDGNEDHKTGFLVGMQYALELLSTFPIKGQPVEDEQQ